jgi:outer membrane biosynthesis protein TonB
MKRSLVSIWIGVVIFSGLMFIPNLGLAANPEGVTLVQDVQEDFRLATDKVLNPAVAASQGIAQAQQEKKPEEMKEKPTEPQMKEKDVDKEKKKKEEEEEEEPSLKPSKC